LLLNNYCCDSMVAPIHLLAVPWR